MEEKILDTLFQMQNQLGDVQNQINDMQGQINDMQSQINDVRNQMHDMQDQINSVKTQMNGIQNQIDNMHEEILDRQFVFEQEYGVKIDAIFDAVTMELDKNLEKSNKIRKLEKRVDRNDVTIFDHEKRISTLELR